MQKEGVNDKNQIKIISNFSKNTLLASLTNKPLEDVSNKALSENKVIFKLYNSTKEKKNLIQLKIFSPNNRLYISSIFPVIDSLGLLVIDIAIFEANQSERKEKLYVYYLSTEPKFDSITFSNKLHLNIEEALEKIWCNIVENDAFNSLIFYTGINYREANLLRVYAKYLNQINFEFNTECILGTLLKYPNLTRDIVKLFNVRFNPDLNYTFTTEKRVISGITSQLSQISAFVEDKILSTYLNLVLATKRTNFFVTDQNSQYRDFISLKIHPKEIENMPLPKPAVDVFVYSAKFEAIHLRGGKVARGGIRWMDSLEGFRKVMLDLVKTQMTKNAIIVPLGCKGGFVVKQNLEGENRRDYFKLGIECYKNFLRGILDITDNIINEKVIPPKNVIRHDKDDSYFVVAADKGTATFPDFANEVSKEYSFWLGDAFASGGSAGYNHKKIGITAKGAWVCVQNHFKEMSIDLNKDVFTAIGIGDMSGDVFGNGMLLSKKMKLIAAFNHIHIFLDPNPDPEVSFKERSRLFKKPKSKWSDYNKDLISEGGGVYDRSLKSIRISSEVKEALSITADHLSPSKLIREILKTPVDLLWNGGIGTYVKGEYEDDVVIGDKANDNLRVLGKELRCKVVGEGGNLGFTQKSRIEYAKKGGKINTDFIDNSAGVDCSDHEVNIKIVLDHEMQAGNITLKERNKILEESAKEVEELVLQDNHKQSSVLNIESYSSINKLKNYAWLINYLEEKEGLERKIESLPTKEEVNKMDVKKESLTRPEIAILLTYAKNSITKILNSHDFMKDEFFQKILLSYFPRYLQENFKKAILSHKLGNEIITTVISNDFVNTLGCTTFHLLMEEQNYNPIAIIKAFYVVMESTNIRNTLDEIQKLSIPFDVKYKLFLKLQKMIKNGITWLLMNYSKIDKVDGLITIYKEDFNNLLPGKSKYSINNIINKQIKKVTALASDIRLPKKVVSNVAYFNLVSSFFDIIMVNNSVKIPIYDAVEIYFAIVDRLHIDKILELTNESEGSEHIECLANDYTESQLRKLIINFISAKLKEKRKSTDKLILDFIKDTEELKQFDNFVEKILKNAKKNNSFMLIQVFVNKLKELLQIYGITYDEKY